jgi:hypothetical protein
MAQAKKQSITEKHYQWEEQRALQLTSNEKVLTLSVGRCVNTNKKMLKII